MVVPMTMITMVVKNNMKGSYDSNDDNMSFSKQEICNIMKLKQYFLDDAIKSFVFIKGSTVSDAYYCSRE